MAYATYITEALICGTKHRNTADSSYMLFTREAGMLFADARSVREERSRQRFALQDFSLVRVSLIKGKNGWRVGSVESLKNFYADAVNKEARGSVVALVRFMRRFVHGEEANSVLYDYLIEALTVVSADLVARSCVGAAVELRMLETLGYVASAVVPPVLHTTPLTLLDTQCNPALQKTIERIIDTATDASHL